MADACVQPAVTHLALRPREILLAYRRLVAVYHFRNKDD